MTIATTDGKRRPTMPKTLAPRLTVTIERVDEDTRCNFLLAWESAIKRRMVADPDPEPIVPISERNRSIIQGHSDRPGAGIASQSLQVKAWMRRILSKSLVRSARGILNFRGQVVKELPEFFRAA